jgi:hypothetical protein
MLGFVAGAQFAGAPGTLPEIKRDLFRLLPYTAMLRLVVCLRDSSLIDFCIERVIVC